MLARAKAVPIQDELARRGITLKRIGTELVGPCPVCAGTDRFGVNIRKQVFNCRGCQRGGDVIDLIMFLDSVSVAEAIATLTSEQARPTRRPVMAPPAVKVSNNGDDERQRLEAARRIWSEAGPIKGTAGEAYFERRGIALGDVPNCGGLRFHSRCLWESGTAPCVVARFTDAITAAPRGIWRRPVDGGKPKSFGPMRGAVIRLWPDEDVTTGLVIGEGVETTLSAATRLMSRGTLLRPAWAAASAGNLENFPVLPGIEALTILADNDANERGQDAAKRCAVRWAQAGREVIKFTPHKTGCDFNDTAVRP
jgi:phage/plasmid primase-like uncharacterized protein